jgi:RNA recognition motif-containing protein
VRSGPLKGTIVNNILVGNLSLNVTEQDIRSLFDKHGAVRRSKMMTDHFTGLSRGFGFIEMKTDAQAEEAVVALNGTDLNGKALKVNHARPQLHRNVRGKSKE